MKTLLAVFLLTGAALGQNNGNYWRSLSREMKIAYVVGYSDGAMSGTTKLLDAVKPLSVQQKSQLRIPWCCSLFEFPNGTTYGQTADAIDQFYQNANNRLISISDAWDYAKAEVEGNPWSAAKLQQTRKLAATSIVPDSRP